MILPTDITTAVGSFVEDITDVANHSQEVLGQVQKTVRAVEEARTKTQASTVESGEKLKTALEAIQSVQKLTEISQAIVDIADQTNLLALNASIEAARAGDAGRGFAVVADEINQLSSATKVEVAKVDELTDEIMSSVDSLTEQCNKVMDFMNKDVIEDLENYGKLAANYENDLKYYTDRTDSLSSGIEEIRASMDNINGNISVMATAQKELDDAVELVNGSLQSMTYAASEANEASDQVMGSVNSLKEVVSNFREV